MEQKKKTYTSPKIITHEPILFETALSGASCPGGHWEFQMSDTGFWKRVCVKD
ncbi:hypothetical protein ACFQI7_08255 [Paenibacillus allorhizosphaerae]|uniref:RiPP n=1 Tax=Paenibacillus allorhizosphaerae TaxID=2849866 RepID=A0ABM8VGJ0_9BACL|nr:hypothetical protein [Paenibacillus allorhizosphaerae]CAG7638690.1 hypothetical protein PAECIP111802_02467 [Paenibacillus allorhizosphaerae]